MQATAFYSNPVSGTHLIFREPETFSEKTLKKEKIKNTGFKETKECSNL